jgi:hypothetical protein
MGPSSGASISIATLPNHVELVRLFTLAEQDLAGVKAYVGRASDQDLEVTGLKLFQEWVLRQNGFECFHSNSSRLMRPPCDLIHFPELHALPQ